MWFKPLGFGSAGMLLVVPCTCICILYFGSFFWDWFLGFVHILVIIVLCYFLCPFDIPTLSILACPFYFATIFFHGNVPAILIHTCSLSLNIIHTIWMTPLISNFPCCNLKGPMEYWVNSFSALYYQYYRVHVWFDLCCLISKIMFSFWHSIMMFNVSKCIVSFSCGSKQSGQLSSSEEALDGIMGFGQANSSVLSQLAAAKKVPKMFSHCLDNDKGGGIWSIGELIEPKMNTTPLIPNQYVIFWILFLIFGLRTTSLDQITRISRANFLPFC